MLILPLFVAAIAVAVDAAEVPVNVDDTSPLVTYSSTKDWTTHTSQAANWSLYQNTDSFSSAKGAWVSFSFIGSAIEYWGNQGPYHGPCSVQVDDLAAETVPSNLAINGPPILLYSKRDLAQDQNHTIKVTVVNSSSPNVCELDEFIYTPASKIVSKKVNKSIGRYIAIGCAIGGALLLILIGGCCIIARKRSKKHSLEEVIEEHAKSESGPPKPAPRTNTRTSVVAGPGGNRLVRPDSVVRPMSSHSVSSGPLSPAASSYAPLITPTEQQIPAQYIANPYILPQGPGPHGQPQPQQNIQNFNGRTVLSPPNVPQNMYEQVQSPASPYWPSPQTYPQQGQPLVLGSPIASQSSYSPPPSVHTQSPPRSPAPTMLQHQPIVAAPAASSSSAPFQHEDGGRVEGQEEPQADELPPAYKDAWSGQR